MLVLLLAPVFLFLTRAFLRFPAKALSLYCHAGAACLTLWGCALALLLGFWEIVQNLRFLHTGGALSSLIPLSLTAALLAVLYFICYRLIRWCTKPPA